MQVSVPAKIILFGEHAVVYDQPAIAVPVSSMKARVAIETESAGKGLTIRSPRTRHTFHVQADDEDAPQNTLAYAAWLTLQRLGVSQTPDFTLTLNSDIPIGRGLGSGAAVSTAVARAVCAALARPMPDEELNAIIYEVERRHHGTPSGIDNTVIVYGRPVFFRRGQPIEPIIIAKPFTLLVADSGYSTPTHLPVGDVRRLVETQPERTLPLVERIGEIAQDARTAIEAGDIRALGPLMNENHDLLQRLTVSSVELDLLVDAALEVGAWGGKLSGGGRGGNMLALVTDATAPRVTKYLKAAGACASRQDAGAPAFRLNFMTWYRALP